MSGSVSTTNPSILTTQLIVHEVFLSIQGESTHAGRICTFVRLAGCPHACAYCDTTEARPFDAGDQMTIGAIVELVESHGCPLVEITGGEPLAQLASADLARCLIERGYEVLVETSGIHPIDNLPREAVKIMDLKCPSSGECDRTDWSNLEYLTERDEIKFVIADRADYDWACATAAEHNLIGRFTVLFSPVSGQIDPRELAAWVIEDRLLVRLQLQLHKLIWGPGATGV
jgi:7-carboxy-7-deazaguanine synthase